MPRKISGLDGGTRIPLRGLTKLLQNLPPAARDRLQSAFTDAENLLDYYDRSVRDKQNKRRISGLVDQPVLFVEQSILGASIRFERLDDPRISFYEIQVDDTNTFPAPEVFQVVDPFFAIDGITSIKHIRARGVRGVTGETGNWSDTVTARPTLTAPKAYSCQFYQRYSGSQPDLFKKRSFGGQDTPGFYTLLDCTFYSSRLVGGMSLWGMVSNRLKKPLNAGVRPWDRLKFTINGITRMENYFPLWTDTFFDTDTPQINPITGAPMSFYMQGGYTAGFGPYNLAVPVIERGQGPMDPRAFDDIDAPGCGFYWSDEGLIFRPSRLDTGQLDNFDDFIHKGREAEAGIATDASTSYLVAKDFGFSLPAGESVQGIEVKIKRRQLNYPATPRELLPLQHSVRRSVTDGVQFDYGKNPNKRLLEANYNQSDTSAPAIAESDILRDIDYGRFVQTAGTSAASNIDYLGTSGRSGLTVTPQVGTVDNFNTFIGTNSWTVSTWVNPYNLTGEAQQIIWAVANYTDAGGTTSPLMRLFRGSTAGNVPTSLTIQTTNTPNRAQTYTNVFNTVNMWYHIVVKYTAGDTIFVVRVNDVTLSPATTSGSFTGFSALTNTFGSAWATYQPTGFAGPTTIIGGRGQTAVWNKVLTDDEIRQLFRMRMNGDYRYNQGGYESAANLMHYWLYLPEEPQIQDLEVRLYDSSGVRTDLDNQAEVDELWPKLDEFFYKVTYTPEGQLQATSEGIPHDNVIGIGYQTYGGPFDLWGAADFDYSEVEDREFGVAIRAMNPEHAFPGVGYVDHIKMTIYTTNSSNNISVKLEAEAANQFYTEREVFGGLFNAIETGEIPL